MISDTIYSKIMNNERLLRVNVRKIIIVQIDAAPETI